MYGSGINYHWNLQFVFCYHNAVNNIASGIDCHWRIQFVVCYHNAVKGIANNVYVSGMNCHCKIHLCEKANRSHVLIKVMLLLCLSS